MTEKRFYSCLDTNSVAVAPQPLQHLANGDMARKQGGTITFYTAEDFQSLASQGVIRAKIAEDDNIDGVVFFTLRQFGYGEQLNTALMREFLNKGLEIHFAREGLSVTSLDSLNEQFPMLYSDHSLAKRDADRRSWQWVWDSLGSH